MTGQYSQQGRVITERSVGRDVQSRTTVGNAYICPVKHDAYIWLS